MAPAERHRQSDRDVFVEWMVEHRGVVVKIVRSFRVDPADADDPTQEITLALWQSIPSFRGESKASTWIWRVALNRAISWQRAANETHTAVSTT